MKIIRFTIFLILFVVALFFWRLMGGDLQYWYLVLLITLCCENVAHGHLTKAKQDQNHRDTNNNDEVNINILLWLCFLGIGITGFIFCLSDFNLKIFILWIIIITFAIYKLSRYFDNNNEPND